MPVFEAMERLSRSWQTMIHGTLVKIMANHDTWNACQDGKIMARSSQDNHGLSGILPKISCQKFD